MEESKRQEYESFKLSVESVDWVINNLNVGSTILELGSGYRSCELGEKFNIFSVEHDYKWVNLCDNVTYMLSPIIDDWYNVEILKKELIKKYDLLIVDGPPNKYRVNFIKNYNLFYKSKLILIDDTDRESDKKIVDFLLENNYEILNIINSNGVKKKQTTIMRLKKNIFFSKILNSFTKRRFW